LKVSLITPIDIKYSYQTAERLIYEWTQFLSENGFDATVLVPNLPDNPPSLREDYKEIERHYSNVPKKRIENPMLHLGLNHKLNLYKGLPKEGTVFFLMSLYDYLPNVLLRPKGQKYLIGAGGMTVFRDGHVTKYHQLMEGIMNFLLTTFVLRGKEPQANLFYYVINHRQENYLLKLGIERSKIFYIPGYVDTKKFLIKKPYGEKLKVLHIGGKGKNSQLVIDVIKELTANGEINKFQFSFIGKNQPEELSEYANKLDNISCLGTVTDKEKVEELSKSDVLIVPDPEENFALVMLEGLSSGLALIVDEWNPVIDELISNGAMAYKGKKDEPKTYLRYLLKLSKMKKNRGFEKAKRTNREIVVRKFDKDVVLKQVKEMFLKIDESTS
jgi:glycosyltransferase involved in cell wall biosynthesis